MIKLAPPKDKLGYIWAYCNYAITLAKERNEEVALCTQAYSRKMNENFVDKTDLLKEVLELLDYDVTISFHNDKHASIEMDRIVPYCRTKVTWSLNKVTSYRVAYQLDGDDIRKWYRGHVDGMRYFKNNVLNSIALSKELNLSEVVEILSTSFMFIGADSGMSHVAHSVGIPMFILGDRISHNITKKWHPNNKYELIGSLQEFSSSTYPMYCGNIAKYIELGAKYGNNR